MKKTSKLILILLFIGFSYTYAQVNIGVQVSGGLATAFNTFPDNNGVLINSDGSFIKSHPILSYGANLYLAYLLSDDYAFVLEPGLILKGYGQQVDEAFDITYNNRVISYLSLPVLMEYRLMNSLNISLGPEFNYLIDAKLTSNDGMLPQDISNYFSRNKLDVSLQAGVFYHLSNHFDIGVKSAISVNVLERFFIEIDALDKLIKLNKKNFYLNAFIRVRL